MEETYVEIINLSYKEVKKFFFENESYASFGLPPYFNFKPLLKVLSTKINKGDFSSLKKEGKKPNDFENINYKIMYSKDGKFDWRPLEIINPLIYSWLVNQITSKENWGFITTKLKEMQSQTEIMCYSIPVKSINNELNLASQVNRWVEKIEQESIILGLEYDYILHTDISNCYGSIYSHNIARALHGKEFAKNNSSTEYIGNEIDKTIQCMCYGQTNGIPQGSILMDFIAEIVLSYIDVLISKGISSLRKGDRVSGKYQILRYRDDYRVFCEYSDDCNKILKVISKVLAKEGMKLNSDKTITSSDVIMASIKDDKWFNKTEIFKISDLKSKLLQIFSFSKKFQNSGALLLLLSEYYTLLQHSLIDIHISSRYIYLLVSIVSDIEKDNPRVFKLSSAIISLLVKELKNNSEKKNILDKVSSKFKRSINTELQEVWLQRTFIGNDISYEVNDMNNLCQFVIDRDNDKLWNFEWVNDKYCSIINETSIIDDEIYQNLPNVIEKDEFKLFDY